MSAAVEDRWAKHRVHMKKIQYSGKGTKKPGAGKTRNVSKKHFIMAIRGSGAIKVRVARRLGIAQATVTKCLARWPDLQPLWQEEEDRIIDQSEMTVMDLVRQREDLPTALNAAKLVLQSKGVTRGWRKQLTIQGGENPIKIQQAVVNLDQVNLPIEVRRQMLAAIESQPPAPTDLVVAAREVLQLPAPQIKKIRIRGILPEEIEA